MTYEEKLQKIVSKLKDERIMTRTGHKTKVTFNDSSFTKVRIAEIGKILLQLQDDKKILTILDAYELTDTYVDPYDRANKDNYDDVDTIVVEVGELFDAWHEKYLMRQKTSLENLDFINMLRIYDTIQDINEQIQLLNKTTVHIPIIPPVVRYAVLFPRDTPGFRTQYCDNRLGSLKYLKEKGVITSYSHGQNGWDTIITVSFVLSKFEDFYTKIQAEYVKSNKPEEKTDMAKTVLTKNEEKEVWPTDFKCEGKTFTFGKYGAMEVNSKNRRHILKTLMDKKGGWATITELKGNKDAGYVRSTIKDRKNRMPKEVKKIVNIISTQDDNSDDKPKIGAYKITIRP